MNSPPPLLPSKARPKTTKPPNPDDADTLPVVAHMMLTQRALAGDVDAGIWWLARFGNPRLSH